MNDGTRSGQGDVARQWQRMPVGAAVVLSVFAGLLAGLVLLIILGVAGVWGSAITKPIVWSVAAIVAVSSFIGWWRWSSPVRTSRRRRGTGR